MIKLGDLIVNTLEDYLGNHNLEHQVSLVKVFSTSAIFECAPIIFKMTMCNVASVTYESANN